MPGIALSKVFKKSHFYIIIVVFLLIIGIGIYFFRSKQVKKEGFLDPARILFGDTANRRYNSFSEITDQIIPGFVPPGVGGDNILNGVLKTANYSGDYNNKNLAAPTYTDPVKYMGAPDIPGIMEKIKMCEAVTSWSCESFLDPEFAKYCVICPREGFDHENKPHIGGLYMDPRLRDLEKRSAEAEGRAPVYKPTVGVCARRIDTNTTDKYGRKKYNDIDKEFYMDPERCFYERDRNDCASATLFTDPNVIEKCALCSNKSDNTFVFIGSRKGKDKNYALIPKPKIFTARLRFVLSDIEDVNVLILKMPDISGAPLIPITGGSFLPNTNTYILDLPNSKETDRYRISITYPRYKPYTYTKADSDAFDARTKVEIPKLVHASYGEVSGNPYHDKRGGKYSDVTNIVKSLGITDCSNMGVLVMNDILGGDPAPSMPKQLRLAFGDIKSNGVNAVNAFGLEGEVTKPVFSAYTNNCPVPPTEAQKNITMCEYDTNNNPSYRIFTDGQNSTYQGLERSTAKCIIEVPNKKRGIVGLWESVGKESRSIPLDLSVLSINGFRVDPAKGVKKYGSIRSSKNIQPMDSKLISGIPDTMFWFWDKDQENSKLMMDIQIPGTFIDIPPMIPPQYVIDQADNKGYVFPSEDAKIYPSGPLISLAESAARLQAGNCEAPYKGKPQGTGNISPSCLKSIFLNVCDPKGKMYKDGSLDAPVQSLETIDSFTQMVNDKYNQATTGLDSDGTPIDIETQNLYELDCFGIIKKNPCDSAFKETGPHPVQCLDYLFRNAGKDTPGIGDVYPGMYNRSSGTGLKESSPLMYCQRTGTIAPINDDRSVNKVAVAMVNSLGSIDNIKKYYQQVHYDANFNNNSAKQADAVSKCYGPKFSMARPACVSQSRTRYVRVRQAIGGDCLQIPQIEVFDDTNTNVALKKQTYATSVSPWGDTNPAKAVDGTARPRAHPDEFVIGNNCSNPNDSDYWQVDLGNLYNITSIVYYNRTDCCSDRSIGVRIQLLDAEKNIIKEAKLQGGMVETVLFTGPDRTQLSAMIQTNSTVQFIPAMYPGNNLYAMPGGEIIMSIGKSDADSLSKSKFLVAPSFNGNEEYFSFKLVSTGQYLRIQGYKLRLSDRDDSDSFKLQTSFKVTEAVSGTPGALSYEPASNPGLFLCTNDNLGVSLIKPGDPMQLNSCSWLPGSFVGTANNGVTSR